MARADLSGCFVRWESKARAKCQPVYSSTFYPSGRVINYAFDGAGRVNQVFNYADAVGYASHGAVNSLTLHNGVAETTTFNNRLQVQTISAATASSTLLTLGYAYCPNGGPTCATNNGNL